MDDSLKKYQEVLINLTLENKTIYLDKIDRNNFLDLHEFKNYNKELYDSFINFVFDEETEKVELISNPLEWQSLEIQRIRERSEQEKLYKSNSVDDDEYKDFLEDFYVKKVSKELEILNKNYINMLNINFDLEILCGKKQERNLYIGYPFIEGYMDMQTYLNMPLFLIPVKIFNEKNAWYIQKNFNDKVQINKYLLLMIEKIMNKKIDIKTEYDFNKEFKRDVVYYVLDLLKTSNITLSFASGFLNTGIEKFSGKLRPLIDGKPYIKVRNFMIGGNFKTIDGFFKEYEELDNCKELGNVVTSFVNGEKKVNQKDFKQEDLSNKLYIKDTLDFAQQEVLKRSNHEEISVINSPIGTGKITTIANFILDKLGRNKKVLVVSKSNDSLLEINERLKNIDSVIINLNKNVDFLNKFKISLEENLNKNLDENIFEDFEKTIENIDNEYNFIIKANEIYNKTSKFGLSLQEMYELTMGMNVANVDSESFKKFTQNNPVSGCTFNEIVCAIDKIKNGSLIELFIKYKQYLNKYKIIAFVREDFDIHKREIYISKLEELKNKYEFVKLNIEKNDCSLKIIELFLNGIVNKTEILNEAKKFDKDYEKEDPVVLKNENEGWFKNLQIFKGKKSKEKINELSSHKVLTKAEIYYKAVNKMNKDISFLEEILKAENFKYVKDKIFSFEDITDFIQTLCEMLESFHDFLGFMHQIQKFDSVLKDILEYTYDNSINEEMMEQNLQNILKYSIIINIMRSHNKYGDELMQYKFIDDHFENLKVLLKDRKDNVEDFVLNRNFRSLQNFMKNTKNRISLDENLKWEEFDLKTFIENHTKTSLKVLPCFLMNYKNISGILPLVYKMFDYVVIEDGHNYEIPEILPTLYRGKHIVVFGDNNQIDFKNKIYNLISSSKQSDFIVDNFFSFLVSKYDVVNLKYSYLNKSYILRDISNVLFDSSSIINPPSLFKFENLENPFEIFKINSKVIDGINRNEAEFVIGLLYDTLKNKKFEESVGIITLNKAHNDLILEILEEKLKLDEEFSLLYYRECRKYSNTLRDGIYIKNIGDISYEQRDIVIFSLGGGFSVDGNFEINFSELEDVKGYNHLKIFSQIPVRKVKVVSSFNFNELDFKDYDNENINILKKYLYYANLLSLEKFHEVSKELYGNDENGINNEDILCDIQRRLMKLQIVAERNVGNDSYKFDLGIYDKELKKYVLFIDIDGRLNKKFENSLERDIESVMYFNKFGFNVLKIWNKDLWSNLDTQIKEIVDRYNFIKKSIKNSENNKQELISKFLGVLNKHREDLIQNKVSK